MLLTCSCVQLRIIFVASKSECKHGTGENRDTRGLLSVFIYCINFATVYFGNNSCGTLDRDTEGIRSV